MKRSIVVGSLGFASVLAAGIAVQGQSQPSHTDPQGRTMPWGQTSDEIAWQTFAQIVAPSGAPRMKAAEFETWASDQDIYQTNPVWPSLGAPKKLQTSVLRNAGMVHGAPKARVLEIINPGDCVIPGGMPDANPPGTAGIGSGFPTGGCMGEEVRRNWASYQYIVRNHLYTQAGLASAYAANLVVSLPTDSIELKADWVPVATLKTWLHLTDQQVAQNYYTNTASSGGTTNKYALLSFHFATKQQSDWVWSDFEHEGNPGRCDTIGCHDSYGARVANVQPNGAAWQSYGQCAKSSQVAALLKAAGLDPVWSHYCLKGSQVTYTQSDGKTPVLLGNSVIEAINANVPIAKSSCQSCHAVASYNSAGAPNIPALRTSPVGNVNPALMVGYKSADFIWGVIVAPQSPTRARARPRG
jgi:hypothetical protein